MTSRFMRHIVIGTPPHPHMPVLTPAQYASLVRLTARNPALVTEALKAASAKWRSSGGVSGLGQSSSSGSSGGFWSDLTGTISALTPAFTSYEQSQNNVLTSTGAANYLNSQLAANQIASSSSTILGMSTTTLLLIGGAAVLAVVLLGKKRRS